MVTPVIVVLDEGTQARRISGNKVAALEQAANEGEIRSERWREQAETAARTVASLQTDIAALTEDLREAKTIAERWRNEARDAAKRSNDLLAELYELTCEHVEVVALYAVTQGHGQD